MHQKTKLVVLTTVLLLFAAGMTAQAATIYLPGAAPVCADCVFGSHLAAGPTGSVPGVGGGGIDATNGTLLNGLRTYIY